VATRFDADLAAIGRAEVDRARGNRDLDESSVRGMTRCSCSEALVLNKRPFQSTDERGTSLRKRSFRSEDKPETSKSLNQPYSSRVDSATVKRSKRSRDSRQVSAWPRVFVGLQAVSRRRNVFPRNDLRRIAWEWQGSSNRAGVMESAQFARPRRRKAFEITDSAWLSWASRSVGPKNEAKRDIIFPKRNIAHLDTWFGRLATISHYHL
jgi:hypothetical protein